MRDWLHERTGFRNGLKHLLDEPLPQGVGWWFVTGSVVMFLLTVQLVTGLVLTFFYSPSPDYAHDSVNFIMTRVAFGRVLRGLHFFGASFLVIAAVVHMLRVVLLGSYKKPRELNWVIGVVPPPDHPRLRAHRLSAAVGSTGVLGDDRHDQYRARRSVHRRLPERTAERRC